MGGLERGFIDVNDDQATVRELQGMKIIYEQMKIVVDNLVESVLCNRVQIDLLQAQIKLLSQRIDILNERMSK